MKSHFFKILLFTGLLLVNFYTAFAQPDTQSIFMIGVKQGVNLSKINFVPTVDQTTTIGYTGGLAFKYISEKHVGIQMELNFSKRGWTENLDSGKSYKRELNYFEIPVLTHFIFGQKKTRAFLNVGPSFSFHLNNKESFHLPSVGDTLLYYGRKLDKNFELGLVGGVGITQSTSLGDFQLEFRFLYGLQNIFAVDSKTDLGKSQNQLYGITLSYYFFKKDYKANK